MKMTLIVIIWFNLQKRVDTVSLNEKRRKEEREEVKRRWLPGRGTKTNYHVITPPRGELWISSDGDDQRIFWV